MRQIKNKPTMYRKIQERFRKTRHKEGLRRIMKITNLSVTDEYLIS